MEVVLDLDVDAQQTAREQGVNLVRAGTVGSHPSYVAMVRELIEERMAAPPSGARSADSVRATTSVPSIVVSRDVPGSRNRRCANWGQSKIARNFTLTPMIR